VSHLHNDHTADIARAALVQVDRGQANNVPGDHRLWTPGTQAMVDVR
jgi:hypothetical protein